MKKANYKPRLSIPLPEELKTDLDKILGKWRVRTALYEKITSDLVAIMKKMTVKQRRTFIVAIVEGYLKPEEYIGVIKKSLEE